MANRRRRLWVAVLIGALSSACEGDDTSTSGAGGSAATSGTGGAAGEAGSTNAGGASGDHAGGSGGAGGAGAGGSGGAGGTFDAGADGAGASGSDAATEPPPDGGEGCLPAGTLTVVNSGSNGYSIGGGPLDAPITLCRGRTYTFSINAPGHPFYIRWETGLGFDNGVTGNYTAIGNLVFSVPSDAPSTLFYQCDAHEWMTGPIFIVD